MLIFQDFGDGGAFPEIAVAQYPLGMGQKKSSSNALAVQLDAEGKIKYDAIAKQGHGKDKVRSDKKGVQINVSMAYTNGKVLDQRVSQQSHTVWHWGYKTFFMLNSAEHEIFSANKYENAIVGIFIFISRENFMLSYV